MIQSHYCTFAKKIIIKLYFSSSCGIFQFNLAKEVPMLHVITTTLKYLLILSDRENFAGW